MLLRKLYDREPELLDRFHHVNELVQVYRFGYVTICMQVVTFDNVLFGSRRSQYDNGDAF